MLTQGQGTGQRPAPAEEFTMQFSWLPDGRIVYLNHDDSRLDKTKSTLWIMNADGSNKKPLTFNNPKIIY